MKGLLGSLAVLCWVGFLPACVLSSSRWEQPPEPGATASAVVGPSGGTLRLGDAVVVVPAHALAQPTELRITTTEQLAPAAFAGYSPVYRLEPVGQSFMVPVSVTLPYRGPAASATVFATISGSERFAAFRTSIEDGRASTRISIFGEAFVGSGCAEDDCCDPANSELDVVLLVDNSNSMQEEQAALAEQIPRMARVLASGDLDGDGEQDFPALTSVRVGVVTSDMGSGGFTVMTCDEPVAGDDGVLRTTGAPAIEGCEASYPPYAELGGDEGEDGIDSFVQHVRCVGLAGTGGCGFEQQLEAALKAVTPSTSSVRFAGETTGHGDGANAGFLRTESILALVLLTDEEDCSAADPSVFDPERTDLGPLNVRCAMRQGSLHPVTRYVEGLRQTRSDPADVVFALIAGVPVDLVTDPASLDYDAILADPRMVHRIAPGNPNELVPSCSSGSGLAYPPRRLVEAAQGFGDNGVVQSICQSDFTPAMGAILERVAARARGECVAD